MILHLTKQEIGLLEKEQITLDINREYTEEEALSILERVRDLEELYAQDYGNERESLYFKYGDIADKIQAQIPEDYE